MKLFLTNLSEIKTIISFFHNPISSPLSLPLSLSLSLSLSQSFLAKVNLTGAGRHLKLTSLATLHFLYWGRLYRGGHKPCRTLDKTEEYSEPCQTSKMELLQNKKSRRTLHLRCLAGF